MKVPFADFQAQWESSRTELQQALERVGRSGWLVLGEEVAQFERDLATAWGTTWAVGCANGLDALEIALRSEGVRPGDRVLTTPLSAFATTLAILRAGATPVFADVDETGLLDLEAADLVLRTSTQPIRFIMPVHLFGHAMDLEALETLARRHGLIVIEDCAQAIGARSRGRAVGTVGRVCATSFYPTKNLGALGDGGALLGSDPDQLGKARCLRDYGQAAKYEHVELGLNSRLDELQAAFLRTVQLPRLAAQTSRRRELARKYRDGLHNPSLRVPPEPPGSESAWHLFPVLIEGERESFMAHLKEAEVASAVHYPVLIPDQRAMQGIVGDGARLPNATRFAQQEVSLPLHPYLSDEQVEFVIETANRWENRRD